MKKHETPEFWSKMLVFGTVKVVASNGQLVFIIHISYMVAKMHNTTNTPMLLCGHMAVIQCIFTWRISGYSTVKKKKG